MRVAFYGRVSTDDAQDPSLSIPRQLGKCDLALEPIDEKAARSNLPRRWLAMSRLDSPH